MLQLIGVFPMNLNKVFYGDPSGKRKKREILTKTKSRNEIRIENEEPAERILNVIDN